MLALPVVPNKPKRRSKKFFTLHNTQNTVYATRPPNPESLISVIAFTNPLNAKLMGLMIEEYKRKTNEWPSIISEEVVMLPVADESNDLVELSVVEWDEGELNSYCAMHILDLIVLYNMKQTKDGYTISGNNYKIECPVDFYRERFNTLYNSNPYPPSD
jgi:hypothetical protein